MKCEKTRDSEIIFDFDVIKNSFRLYKMMKSGHQEKGAVDGSSQSSIALTNDIYQEPEYPNPSGTLTRQEMHENYIQLKLSGLIINETQF